MACKEAKALGAPVVEPNEKRINSTASTAILMTMKPTRTTASEPFATFATKPCAMMSGVTCSKGVFDMNPSLAFEDSPEICLRPMPRET